MTTCKVSRSIIFGMVFLLALQVIGSNAILWFGKGKKNNVKSTTENGKQDASGSNQLAHKYKFDIETSKVLSESVRGKELYQQSKAIQSVHSCWQEAYTGLESSCREILRDEAKKSRLALKLTNCFLKASGRSLIKKCPENWPVATCVKSLDDHNHKIFLAFYVDSSAMCHYLQSEEFRAETEKLVNDLKMSAHYTEDKLGSMGQQLEEQHAVILEKSETIMDIHKKLQTEHALLQENIEQGMGNLQEAANEAQEQLDLVNKYQQAIAEKQKELAENLQSEFSELQKTSNKLGSSMTNLHGSVDDLAEKSLAGQEEAAKGLSELQRLQLDALAESKMYVNALIDEAHKHKEEFQSWQMELDGMHHRLVDGTTNMIVAQEKFVDKQAIIFTTMDKLFSLHNKILHESRGVKTLMLYFALSLFVYMVTTTKQTQSARVLLYFGLFVTLTFEVWLIRFKMDKLNSGSMRFMAWPPKQIVWVRYTYGIFGLVYIAYKFLTYKDYEYLNYRMLKDLHGRFGDQSRLQEKLLSQYLARCETCKDIPPPNGRHSTSERETFYDSEDTDQSKSLPPSKSKEPSSTRPKRRPARSGCN